MKSDQGEAARFLDLACLTYGNDSTDRIDRARRMLADRPSLSAVDAHTRRRHGQRGGTATDPERGLQTGVPGRRSAQVAAAALPLLLAG